MRRATFRMTLESSTTRQVFIVPSLPTTFSQIACSCRLELRRDVEHPVDIENHQKLAVEPMHAGGHPREPRIEIDRIVFPIAQRQLEHLADGVDQQTVGLAFPFDTDCHPWRI